MASSTRRRSQVCLSASQVNVEIPRAWTSLCIRALRKTGWYTSPTGNRDPATQTLEPQFWCAAASTEALRIRNTLGLTVHPGTGELWQTDNGPQGGDEINIIKRGLNYGWPVVTYGRAYTTDPDGIRSGLPPPDVQPPTSAPGMEEPVTFYKPSIAISGMAFYTGNRFPQWKGNLLVGGLAGTQLSRIVFNERGLESRRETLLLELRQRIRDVRQGPDGLLYLTTDMRDGAVLKLEPVAEP